MEFLSCLYSKNDLIKLNTYYVIVESSSSFLNLFLYKDAYFSTLYFSTYQKPLNKYLCTIPLSCFILRVTRGPILESSLCAIPEIAPRLKPFWKCLWLRGCPVGFLLPLFREFKCSNRTKWLSLKRKSQNGRMVVFKSTFNCSVKYILLQCTQKVQILRSRDFERLVDVLRPRGDVVY